MSNLRNARVTLSILGVKGHEGGKEARLGRGCPRPVVCSWKLFGFGGTFEVYLIVNHDIRYNLQTIIFF